MLTSKQRAWLRSQANTLPGQFQIGKQELSEQIVQGLDEMLTTHELLKVTVLRTAETSTAELAHELANQTGAQVVQVIGRKFVLYRYSEKLAKQGKAIQLPV